MYTNPALVLATVLLLAAPAASRWPLRGPGSGSTGAAPNGSAVEPRQPVQVPGEPKRPNPANPVEPANPWTARTPPVRIVDNIYYVGSFDLASYLITTPDGHI